jgi:hypothetical protein
VDHCLVVRLLRARWERLDRVADTLGTDDREAPSLQRFGFRFAQG